MIRDKNTLAIWVLAIANPLICWLIAYLFWKESQPERYKTATNASITVVAAIAAFFLMGAFLSR